MRVALCFSGNIRDLNETKNFWTELIKKYDIDVYASFWDTENEKLGDTINNFLTIYTPKKYEIENYKVFKETTQDIASMHIQAPLNLLNELKQEFKFTYIFISHDLSVVKFMSDRMVVMQNGKIEEMGDADEIYSNPQSEYTKKLINSIPKGTIENIKASIKKKNDFLIFF
jgi:ABC-type sugar transport system ATPase subunit